MPTRRDFLVLAAIGAASLAAAGRRLGLGRLFAEDEVPTKMSVLAKLGQIWREISRHARREGPLGAYEAVGKGMEQTLQQLHMVAKHGGIRADSAAALEAALRERYAHVNRIRYVLATCYDMDSLGLHRARSRAAIEEQVRTLDHLTAAGKLTPEAEAKARKAIAREVSFQTRLRQLEQAARGQGPEAEQAREALDDLAKQYGAGGVAPTKASREAAKTLVGFTAEPVWKASCYVIVF